MRLRILIVGVLALLLTCACSSTPPVEEPLGEKLAGLGYIIGPQVKRINDFQINNWSVVDRRNVIIFFGASRRYLVTTRNPCDGLREAEHLGYSTTAGGVTDKDQLLVRRTSGHVESCFIDTLFELEKVK